MTPLQYLQMLRRRWYVLVVLLVLTGALVLAVPRDPDVYWSRATVVFVPPVQSGRVGNVLEGSDPSLVYFAAAVERRVGGGAQEAQLSSSAAALYGTGVRAGHSVTLINSGGQWQTNFNKPMLSLEVVDRSEEATARRLDDLLRGLEATAETMQREVGAPTRSWIRPEVSPQRPAIVHVAGNEKRALAGLLLVGGGLSLWLVLVADRFLGRRRWTSSVVPTPPLPGLIRRAPAPPPTASRLADPGRRGHDDGAERARPSR